MQQIFKIQNGAFLIRFKTVYINFAKNLIKLPNYNFWPTLQKQLRYFDALGNCNRPLVYAWA